MQFFALLMHFWNSALCIAGRQGERLFLPLRSLPFIICSLFVHYSFTRKHLHLTTAIHRCYKPQLLAPMNGRSLGLWMGIHSRVSFNGCFLLQKCPAFKTYGRRIVPPRNGFSNFFLLLRISFLAQYLIPLGKKKPRACNHCKPGANL